MHPSYEFGAGRLSLKFVGHLVYPKHRHIFSHKLILSELYFFYNFVVNILIINPRVRFRKP